MADQQQGGAGPTLRPRTTRRTFELSPPSAESSAPPSPYPEPSTLDIPDSNKDKDKDKDKDSKDDGLSSRSRSVQNLTASTLFGIYSPTALEGAGNSSSMSLNSSRDDVNVNMGLGMTPMGTGAQTPTKQYQHQHQQQQQQRATATATLHDIQEATRSPSRGRRTKQAGFGNLLLRSLMLFGFGVAYGVIVTHLHDSPRLAPVRVEGIDHGSWQYVVFWGLAGIGLGSLLPWFDTVWEERVAVVSGGAGRRKGDDGAVGRRGVPADWYAVVRSVGAFVGIAFAIRKLPWQSTLQVSLTLALVNPVLWYLIDRSKPGFMLSTVVGLAGMLVLLGINPDMVPPPATSAPTSSMGANDSSSSAGAGAGAGAGGVGVGSAGSDGKALAGAGLSHETIAVGTWIASVLFCSCVCFGNIGRRLALGGNGS